MSWVQNHAKPLLVLGLPLIGSAIAQFATHLTDTIMLGWYDVEDLAAVTLATSLFFVFFAFGMGIGQAVSPIVAEAEASGNSRQVRRATRMGIWLSLGYSALIVPLFWNAGPLLEAIGQTPDTAARAQAYLRIAGFGMFPGLISVVLRSFLAAMERTRVILTSTLGTVLLNIIVNYLLIFGNLGFPEMGIRGAAIATISVGILSVLWLSAFILRELPEHELFRNPLRPDWEALREVFALGVPIGFTNLAEGGLFAASSVMMGWIGTYELAAHGVALQITALTFMVHVGLGQAATVRAGRALGRRDFAGLRQGAIVALGAAGVAVALTITAFLTIPEVLIGLFVDPRDPARDVIIPLGARLLAVAALFQLVDAAQAMFAGLLRGIKDTRVPMMLAVVSYWLCGIPAAYLFAFGLDGGAVGLWLGLVVGLALAAGLLGWRFWARARAL